MTFDCESETSSNDGDRRSLWLVTVGMILAAAMCRLIPHPPNLTPIGAMALFGGAVFVDRRLAYLVPIAALMLSDLLIGFDRSMVYVYGAMLAITALGSLLKNWRRQPIAIVAGSLGASLLFFVVTNFGVWLSSGWYGHTLPELARCYVQAIPFFGNTVLGDLLFSGLLFGSWAVVESRLLLPQAADA